MQTPDIKLINSGDVRLTGNFSEKVIAWVEEAKKFQADLLLLEETSFSFIEEPVKSSNEEKVEKYIQRLISMKNGRNFLRKIIQGLHL